MTSSYVQVRIWSYWLYLSDWLLAAALSEKKEGFGANMKKHFISMHIAVCAITASNGPFWSSAEQQTYYKPKSCKAETHKLKMSKCYYYKNRLSSEWKALWPIWCCNHGTHPWTVPYRKCLPLKNILKTKRSYQEVCHWHIIWQPGSMAFVRTIRNMSISATKIISFDTVKPSITSKVQIPSGPVFLDLLNCSA